MITFRTSHEVKEDRRVVLNLPPETPVGQAELTVSIMPQGQAASQPGSLRRFFGIVRSGNPRSADNERIDADLAATYQDSRNKAS